MQYFCWVFCQLGFALDNLATEASLIPQAFEWSAPLTSLTRLQLLDQTPTQLANIASTCPPPHDGPFLLRIAPWYSTAGLLLALATLWAAFWLPVFYWVLSSCCGCLYRCSCYLCHRRNSAANGRYSTPPRARRFPATNWVQRAQQLRAFVSTTKPAEEEEDDTPEEERRSPGSAFCVRSRKAARRERARDASPRRFPERLWWDVVSNPRQGGTATRRVFWPAHATPYGPRTAIGGKRVTPWAGPPVAAARHPASPPSTPKR